MALVRSFIAPDEDETEDSMEYYVRRILVVKAMKRLMRARLNLVEASSHKRIPSLPRNDITQLERDLMTLHRMLLKLVMNRQILNIALQKSTQSALLHAVSRNLFTLKNPNNIEKSVSHEMRAMIKNNELIHSWSEKVNQQSIDILQLEEKLLGRRVVQHERLSEQAKTENAEEQKTKLKAVHKILNSVNKLGSFVTIMVMQILEDETESPDVKSKMIKIAAKWRTPRSLKSLKYYENEI